MGSSLSTECGCHRRTEWVVPPHSVSDPMSRRLVTNVLTCCAEFNLQQLLMLALLCPASRVLPPYLLSMLVAALNGQ